MILENFLNNTELTNLQRKWIWNFSNTEAATHDPVGMQVGRGILGS